MKTAWVRSRAHRLKPVPMKSLLAIASQTSAIRCKLSIDYVPDYLWVKDTESRFVVVNKALASDCGRRKHRRHDRPDRLRFPRSRSRQNFVRSSRISCAAGSRWSTGKSCIVDSSGAKKWLLSTKMPLRNDRQKSSVWLASPETSPNSRPRAPSANERLSLQALIDWLPDNLWVKDVKSRFVIANKVTATASASPGPQI